ncbi:hypothetical protein O9X98_10765 [Agrobacterium salinitolerans]|nr:hypothetical protein [Agrobacterium salinitolerans]
MAETYDWTQSCTKSREDKERFHSVAKRQLKALAKDLGLAAGSFEIRSSMGGGAVSGEISLQHHDFRIEASNPGSRQERGLRMHTCANRGNDAKFNGDNHYAPLTWLEDADRPKLRKLVEQVMEQKNGFNADVKNDPGYNPHYSTPRFSK